MGHTSLTSSALTSLPPCVLAYYPLDNRFFIVGTYQLEQNGSRHGALDIYDCADENLALVSSVTSPDSSILDLKFSPHDPTLLVSAHSTGKVCLWKAIIEQRVLSLKIADTVNIEESALVLSVSFSPTDATLIAATLSSGAWALLSIADEATVSVTKTFSAHQLEAWTSVFSSNGSVLFSGGDDSCLSAFDLRMDTQVWKDSRSHNAGVTSILSFNGNDSQLWTGSYDETLRTWDLRGSNGRGKVSNEIPLGGGVWRLVPLAAHKINPTVLSCCMHGGIRVLETKEDVSECSVVDSITEGHDSMVYGGDWASDGSHMATCSFYDKKLNLWKYS